MFFWDYILTFEMEVDFVWKSKWNFMKGLYLFQRYLPFTELTWFILPNCQLMYFLSSRARFFFTGNTVDIPLEARCWKIHYANGGS